MSQISGGAGSLASALWFVAMSLLGVCGHKRGMLPLHPLSSSVPSTPNPTSPRSFSTSTYLAVDKRHPIRELRAHPRLVPPVKHPTPRDREFKALSSSVLCSDVVQTFLSAFQTLVQTLVASTTCTFLGSTFRPAAPRRACELATGLLVIG
ncbi:hypothetical protein B0T14DRAFT_82278 [Immersiella caudata]|uniref:Uncharacterized protein n=1 Tax=Immersiella caudata TaxID=314043 RepID=A0AA40CDV4_9PEZI|nr:hypothetical protein B0T14DRAFT_82278 [Immersiella caudata]